MNLTPQQRAVAREVATGAVNKDIGFRLGLSPGTVKVYVSAILRRLNLDTRLQLAVWVIAQRYE